MTDGKGWAAVCLTPLNVATPRQTGELRSTKVMDKRDIIFSEQAPAPSSHGGASSESAIEAGKTKAAAFVGSPLVHGPQSVCHY